MQGTGDSMGRSGNMGGGAREPGDHSLCVLCSCLHVAAGGDDGEGSVRGRVARPHDRQEGFPRGCLGRVLTPLGR